MREIQFSHEWLKARDGGGGERIDIQIVFFKRQELAIQRQDTTVGIGSTGV